jgi:hypothetical protein
MQPATLRPAAPAAAVDAALADQRPLALAATAWVLTGDRMSGMDAAPGGRPR